MPSDPRHHNLLLLLLPLLLLATVITDCTSQTVWPKPQSQSSGSSVYSLSQSAFDYEPIGFSSGILNAAIRRYRAITFYRYPWFDEPSPPPQWPVTHGSVTQLTINVTSRNETLSLETDESYTLVVASPVSTITATTVYGALRALETFAQLVVPTYIGGWYWLQSTHTHALLLSLSVCVSQC
jgi:hexosaminidase